MSATFILTTEDPQLAAAWERQLPAPPLALPGEDALRRELRRDGARVWIKDTTSPRAHCTAHADTVVVLVGEPRSIPFEDGKRSCDYALSYGESHVELRRLAPVLAELAELRAVRALMHERPRLVEPAPPAPSLLARQVDDLEFFEAAVDHLRDETRVIDDFRRGARSRLRASRLTIFLREADVFHAVSDRWRCADNHRFVSWLHEHGAIVDQAMVEDIADPAVKVAVRQKFAEWNARMVVPVELHGSLDGWFAVGPRVDGRPYSAEEVEDAMKLGRLFSRLLEQNAFCRTARLALEELHLLQQHGPKSCVVDGAGVPKQSLPVEARQLVHQARREGRRVEQEFGRLRVAAGPIGATGACWVYWDESELTAASTAGRREAERYEQLNDIGLMLQHELSNAITSAATFVDHRRRLGPDSDAERRILDAAVRDTDRLKKIPYLFSTLHEMAKEGTSKTVLNVLLQKVGRELGAEVDIPEAPVVIWGHEGALARALDWLCREIVEGASGAFGPERAVPISLTLRQKGEGEDSVCLITIAYPGLRLEQLRLGEARSLEEFPTVPVFLAREIVRFHRGTIHVGQATNAPELMVALRSRMPAAELAPPNLGADGDRLDDPELRERIGRGPANSILES